MPVFNVSSLRPGAARGGSTYGILVDQLSILENELAKDGQLSPGDYDLLIKKGREIASSGGLTAGERSNVLVKISGYEKGKAVNKVSDQNDVGRLNREVQDDQRTITTLFGNDPHRFLQSNVDLLKTKISHLADSIDQIDSSGGDSSQLVNEQVAALQDLQDAQDALAAVSGYKAGSGKPAGDSVAYIQTNSRGEITSVEVGRSGKSGYAETNALYGGLQVYGKPNAKSGGQNVFRLGGTEYKGSDLQFQDPNNPGSFRSAPLIAGGGGVGVKVENYQDVNTAQLRTASTLRPGDYGRAQDGTLYESLPNGTYRKYVNTQPDQLGLNENDIMKMPARMEGGFNRASAETVYGANLPQMSLANPAQLTQTAPSVANQPAAPETTPPAQGQPQQSAPVSSRTPSPIDRSPKTAPGVASRVLDAAKKFFYG